MFLHAQGGGQVACQTSPVENLPRSKKATADNRYNPVHMGVDGPRKNEEPYCDQGSPGNG
jgi:hypothetical protein